MKLLLRFFAFVLLSAVSPMAFAQSGQSPLPELPADIPKDATILMVLADKTPSGQDAVWITPDGEIHEFFQFNDRGRGPKTYSTYRLNDHGLVICEETHGNDYMKNVVNETFTLKDGVATWKNQAEDGHESNAGGRFFIGIDSGPAGSFQLAQALLKKGNKLPLLPAGEASIKKLQSVPVEAAGKKVSATLYQIDGLSFTPVYVWLDDQQNAFAAVDSWSSIIRQGFESTAPTLLKAQQEVENARAASLAKQFIHHPTGDVVITNIAVFDSINAKVLPKQRVTIHGERIATVEAEKGQTAPSGAQVIDGTGKMLLPGLWDMHQHLSPDSAYLDVAAGITTIRDLGNSIDELGKLKKHIEQGEQVGPRIVMAGFIDGPGPYEGPIKVLAATPEEARQ